MNSVLTDLNPHLRRGTPALPGRGETESRWRRLAAITAQNTVVGRLFEAHADAIAITTDLGRSDLIGTDQLWGVWAAEPPTPVLTAADTAAGWRLTGTKPWCSGASLCSHALVTAAVVDPAAENPSPDADAETPPAAKKMLFAVDLSSAGVSPVPNTWKAVGMAASDSGWVSFQDVPAIPVGTHADYLTRSGFWHGGIGVAACWYGAARAVAEPLLARAAAPSASVLLRAHAGAVATHLSAGWALLSTTAGSIDGDPENLELAKAQALSVRTFIDRMATDVMERTGRALGPGPLSSDAEHAQRVADLSVYIRQSHAETDEAGIPTVIAEGGLSWASLIGDGHGSA